jgi:hypothetical protein
MDIAPINGIKVELDRKCRCGCSVAKIENGKAMHAAGLRCNSCGRHVGWMPAPAVEGMLAVTKKFGWPKTTIRNLKEFAPLPSTNGIERDFGAHAKDLKMSTDFDSIYGSKYLSAADLGGEALRKRITGAKMIELKEKDGTLKKRLAIEIEGTKALILNQTNAGRLAQAFGKDHSQWVNKGVELYAEDTSMGPGVRLRAIQAKKAAPQPEPPDFDDGPPF